MIKKLHLDSILGRGVGSLSSLALAVFFAQLPDKVFAGEAIVTVSLAFLLAGISRFGIDVVAVKNFSRVVNDPLLMARHLRTYLVLMFVSTVVVMVSVWCVAVIADSLLLEDASVITTDKLFIMLCTVLGINTVAICSFLMQAQGKDLISGFAVTGLVNYSTLAVLIFFGVQTVENLLILLMICSSCCAVCLLIFNRTYLNCVGALGKDETRVMFRSAFNMWIVSLCQQCQSHGGQIIVGLWDVSGNSVIAYNFAVRVASAFTLVITAINMSSARRMVEALESGGVAALNATALVHSTAIIRLNLPAVLALFIFAEPFVLGVLGEGPTYFCLAVLLVGQMVNVLTGVVGYYLVVCGEESVLRRYSVFAFVFGALLGGVSASMGVTVLIAVTLALCISIASQNILCAWYVRRQYGFKSIDFGAIR